MAGLLNNFETSDASAVETSLDDPVTQPADRLDQKNRNASSVDDDLTKLHKKSVADRTSPIKPSAYVWNQLIDWPESKVHDLLRCWFTSGQLFRLRSVLEATADEARCRFEGQRADFLNKYIRALKPSDHQTRAAEQIELFRCDQ